MEIIKGINITNEDNMELMARYPDKYFDLAIVDPPYGINMDGGKIGKGKKMTKKNWDVSIPKKTYFKELFRVSKNQIIWGGNYFTDLLKPTKSWLYWDKMQDGFGKTFSSGELSWTSFDFPMKQVRYKWQGNYCGFENKITTKTSFNYKKIHPTQKPRQLYNWLLDNYAKPGDKILDTHLGSGSIAIACHERGFELTACELDRDYYESAIKRIKEQTQQQRLF